VSAVKEAFYRDVVAKQGIDALPGVLRWLTALHSAGWKQAVASAAPRDNVHAILDELSIGGFFSAITSAEDVTRGKPDPQVYLTAALRVNVLPNRCIVIEDAPAGVEGAKRANMRSIGVLTSHNVLEADLVVNRLDELGDDAFERLLPA
jgi:HAD superfamily hydrolase (TIGR01509 family)